MTSSYHVIIMGAGPAGLAAALALAKHPASASSPVRITVLERRPNVQTLGGAVNLTPLALRYLDALGVGDSLRSQAATVKSIEIVAHRTGGLLGQLWSGADAIRVQRQVLIETMLEAAKGLPGEQRIEFVYGARVLSIDQLGSADSEGSVKVTFETSENGSSKQESIEGDMLVGCDGIHSQARSLVVEPSRKKEYSGKCNAYAYATVPNEIKESPWLRADGKDLVSDTTLLSHGSKALLLTYFNQERDQLYLAAIRPLKSKDATERDEGFAVANSDKPKLKREIGEMFADGHIDCLQDIIERSDEWFLFPVYMLPAGGVWSKGRVLLLGDAAHAMPPQGESTGVAIEDGVLLAHVLSRKDSRSVTQLFEDYEKLRRADIDALYKETVWRWSMGDTSPGWLQTVIMMWMTWLVVKIKNMRQSHFARDVREMKLPVP